MAKKKRKPSTKKKLPAKKSVPKKRKSLRKQIYVKNKQRGSSFIEMDKRIKAMQPGKRRSDEGGIYYEYRKNRTDRPNSLTGFFEVSKLNSLDELKKAYYKLAKKYHPDAGGTDQQFRELTAEYEELVNSFLRNGGFNKTEATKEIKIDEAYIETVKAAMKLPNIDIEIIGSWIWVSGMTFPIRQELKKLGFEFAPVKKMWYINTTGMKTKKGKELPIDQIRNRYTSRKLKRDEGSNFFLEGIGALTKPKDITKFKNSLSKLIRTMKTKK